MAKFTIYSKDGQSVRFSGEPQFNGSYMGVDCVEFRNISSPVVIDWERGDYVDYYRTGMRYKLYSLPLPKKVARRGEYGGAFEYSSVQFFAATKELEIAPFRDIVTADNNIHFSTMPDVSTYEDVYGIARRIQACLDDLFPGKWRIEVYDTDDENLLSLLSEVKSYSVNNGNCLTALSQIYQIWKNVGWIHTYDSQNDVDVITIGRANVRDAENTSDVYSYGLGKGLTSIKKASANEGEFATRLYVYGSDRNIQTRHYNQFNILNKDSVDIRNLMLPIEKWGITDGLPDARKAYIQADDSIIEKYGLIPRVVYFNGNENEEIYPSITGLTMAQVRQEMIDAGHGDSEYLPEARTHRIDQIDEAYQSSFGDGSKEDTEKNRRFQVGIRQLGFDLAEEGKKTSEGYAVISMKTGPCAGREFKVRKFAGVTYTKADGTVCRVYEVEKSWDESIGMGYPNTTYPINDGDEFGLLDIPMPDYYITLAEDRLYEAGKKMLADYTRVSAFYEPGMDSIKIKGDGKLLRAGMYMQVYDEDIVDTDDHKDYVLIDTISIDEKSELPSYKITLREQKRSPRSFSALEDMVEDAKEENKEAIKKERQYTDRRFRSAQETLDMLQSAFSNFTDGISPATVRTMAMLIGDESLQFKFTESMMSLDELDYCPLSYDEATKQMVGTPAVLMHMTLDIRDIAPIESRTASSYMSWELSSYRSAILEDSEKPYYVYVRANVGSMDAFYELHDAPKKMYDEENDPYNYYFLVGILNSEVNGTRDFITLYGFTEILPGQITTDVIRSGNANLVIDLANAIITAKNGATVKGSVKIEDGSLISSMLAVGDTSTDETKIEAFLNGGNLAKDSECGKMLLAGGIPTTSSTGSKDLANRAKEATTRVYEDGCIKSKKIILEDGCKIGELLIDQQGIFNDGCSNGGSNSIQINKEGISVFFAENNGTTCTIKRSCNIDNRNNASAFIVIDEDRGDAIRVNKGTFSGLRTTSCYISSVPTSGSYYQLGNLHHNVLFPKSGSYSVKLPSSPENGQEVWLETMGADISVSTSIQMWSHYSGKLETSHSFTSRGVIRFKYYGGLIPTGSETLTNGMWTYSWVESA